MALPRAGLGVLWAESHHAGLQQGCHRQGAVLGAGGPTASPWSGEERGKPNHEHSARMLSVPRHPGSGDKESPSSLRLRCSVQVGRRRPTPGAAHNSRFAAVPLFAGTKEASSPGGGRGGSPAARGRARCEADAGAARATELRATAMSYRASGLLQVLLRAAHLACHEERAAQRLRDPETWGAAPYHQRSRDPPRRPISDPAQPRLDPAPLCVCVRRRPLSWPADPQLPIFGTRKTQQAARSVR